MHRVKATPHQASPTCPEPRTRHFAQMGDVAGASPERSTCQIGRGLRGHLHERLLAEEPGGADLPVDRALRRLALDEVVTFQQRKLCKRRRVTDRQSAAEVCAGRRTPQSKKPQDFDPDRISEQVDDDSERFRLTGRVDRWGHLAMIPEHPLVTYMAAQVGAPTRVKNPAARTWAQEEPGYLVLVAVALGSYLGRTEPMEG